MKLTEFLLARIAEDEAVAKAMCDGWEPRVTEDDSNPGWIEWSRRLSRYSSPLTQTGNKAPFTLYISPHHVLAECQAKRQLVRSAEPWLPSPEAARIAGTPAYESMVWIDVLRTIAQPFADHPDFDPAWRI